MNNQTSVYSNTPTSQTFGGGGYLRFLSVLSLRGIQRGGWVRCKFQGKGQVAETKVPSSPLSPGGDQEPQMAGHRRASACRGAQRPQLSFSAAWRRPQSRPRAPGAWLGRPAVNGVPVGRAGEPAFAAAGERV